MTLLDLPPEILLEIVSTLDVSSVNSLVLSCHHLNHHLTRTLYSFPLRRCAAALRYGPRALLSAATRGDAYMVEKMLKWGILACFDWRVSLDFEGWLFSGKGRVPALETLLRCGMDPVAPFAGSLVPLLYRAAAAGNARAVRVLLAFLPMVPSPGDRRNHYVPALISAVRKGFVDVVEALCEDERVDLGVVEGTQKGFMLHLAVRKGSSEVLRCLLRRNDIDVDARCPSGETPLCWAARKGDLVMVRLLLEEGGASVNLSGCLTQGPDPGQGICLSGTPLHLAAVGGHLGVVQFLAEWEGVDINAQDVGGDSLQDHAVRCEHRRILRVLEGGGAIDKRYEKQRQLRVHKTAQRGLRCFSRNV